MNTITLQPFNTTDQPSLDFFVNLYIGAFPQEERRPLDQEINLCTQRDNLYADLIMIDELPVGFITYWAIRDVIYIEHFAVSPTQRGRGIGSKVINALCEKMGKGILLEVEPPTTEDARRRIVFYERIGFKLHEAIDYTQPSYSSCLSSIPMRLMTLSVDNFIDDHKEIIHELSEKVYKAATQSELSSDKHLENQRGL